MAQIHDSHFVLGVVLCYILSWFNNYVYTSPACSLKISESENIKYLTP